MTTLSVTFTEERLAQLRACAEREGVRPEEFVRLRVEEALPPDRPPFSDVASYVLRKNAGLYRRSA